MWSQTRKRSLRRKRKVFSQPQNMRVEAGEINFGPQLGHGVVALRAPPEVKERTGIHSQLLFAIKIYEWTLMSVLLLGEEVYDNVG